MKINFILIFLLLSVCFAWTEDVKETLESNKEYHFSSLNTIEKLAYRKIGTHEVEGYIQFYAVSNNNKRYLFEIQSISEYGSLQFSKDRKYAYFIFSDNGFQDMKNLYQIDGNAGVIKRIEKVSYNYRISEDGIYLLSQEYSKAYPVEIRSKFKLLNLITNEKIVFEINIAELNNFNEAGGFQIFKDADTRFKITLATDGGGLIAAYYFMLDTRILEKAEAHLIKEGISGIDYWSDDIGIQYRDKTLHIN